MELQPSRNLFLVSTTKLAARHANVMYPALPLHQSSRVVLPIAKLIVSPDADLSAADHG